MKDPWFALHVRSRFEKFVETHLEQKGYEVLCPTYLLKRKWSDRVKTITVPLFPNYVFCRFDLNNRLPILVTPGVNGIVGFGKAPQTVEESEIQAIHRINAAGLSSQPCPFVSVGERVRIESGPLEGLEGIVTRVKGQDRLIVSVSLLMRSVCVEIGVYSVCPVNQQPPLSRPALLDAAIL